MVDNAMVAFAAAADGPNANSTGATMQAESVVAEERTSKERQQR